MYKIIGGDQKEYGPVTAEQLRLWVTEGRVAVLVAGADKAATVARVLRGPARPRELPAQLALGGFWFLDDAAAAELPGAAA